MKRALVLLLILTLTEAVGLVPAASAAALPNGMTLVPVECRGSSICGIHLALKIGPERVPASKAGLRALTQQVLLGRLRDEMGKRGDLLDLRLEGSQGAAFSVQTEWDYVEFRASVTDTNLDKMLKFLAQSVFEADWGEDDIVRAKDLMDRDRSSEGGADTPASSAFSLFRKAILGDTPLAQPVYGTSESRAKITLADVKAFYKSYYVPNLSSLCVVAPLTPKEITDLAAKCFGSYKPREVSRLAEVSVGPKESRVEIGSSPDLDTAVIIVGIPVGTPGTDAFLMGEIVHAALTGPKGSLTADPSLLTVFSLPERLGNATPGVVGVLPLAYERQPYLAAFARAAPTSVEAVRAGILKHFQELATKPLSSEALKRAKARAINLHAAPLEDAVTAASVINRASLYGLDYTKQADYASRISAVTPEALQEFAKTSFTRHAVGVLMPGD